MKTFKNLGSLKIRIQTEEYVEAHPPTENASQEVITPTFYRPRTRSTVTIWNLPDSVLVHILKGMHIRDILSFRSVHPNLRTIIDSYSSMWSHMSFADSWPSERNLHHFVKASEKKNVEATIKLAVAYLYKEGLTKDNVSKLSEMAAKYLCLSEQLTPNTFPFFWIFIRPPWSLDGSCCKVQTFQHIKEAFLEKEKHSDLACGVALTLKLQRLLMQEHSMLEEEKYFKLAVNQNSAAAVFFSMLDDSVTEELDRAKELERIRILRQLASSNVLEAKLKLIKCYTQGQLGGLSVHMAQKCVQDFFMSSKPSGIHLTFNGARSSDISRYILVDWLVEVVGMKDFSAHILYLAVSMFDRFLQVRKVQRSQVQLLGVAAMVVSSRFLGFDILTIKEAAWLTDNSYTYHDVVRMMGELVAALHGDIRVLTIQDYVKVLVAIVGESGFSAMLIEYLAMLCLLQSEMGQYSPAEIAASCFLLSRLLLNHTDPWSTQLQEWTGFRQDSLSLCTFHIYNKCLLEGSEIDYRETKLKAVKWRYADANRFSVSNIEIIGHKELCRRLGVTKLISHGKDSKAIKFRNTDELIMSPRRNMGADYSRLSVSQEKEQVDRSNAATPPIKKAYKLDEGVSGYEGDLEDDTDESFSDKSDFLYELIDENERSSFLDTTDDGKEWEADVSLLEEDTSTIEDVAFLEDAGISGCSHKNSSKRITCLSSMCQSGTNLTCHSAKSSPSSCISNCSCRSSYEFGLQSSDNNSGLSSSLSSISSGHSVLLSSPESSQQFQASAQNVRACIPCGSIQTVPRSKEKLEKKNKLTAFCDTLNSESKYFSLHGGENLSSSAGYSSFNKLSKSEQCKKSSAESISYDVRLSGKQSKDGESTGLAGSNHQNPYLISTKSFYSQKHLKASSDLSKKCTKSSTVQSFSLSSSLTQEFLNSPGRACNEFIPVSCDETQRSYQYLGAPFCNSLSGHSGQASQQSHRVIKSGRGSRVHSFPCCDQVHEKLSMPTTPESVSDSSITVKTNGFPSISGDDTVNYSMKKARLDYSDLCRDMQSIGFRRPDPYSCDKPSTAASGAGTTQHLFHSETQGRVSVNTLLKRKRKSYV